MREPRVQGEVNLEWRGQGGGCRPSPAVQASRAEFSKRLEKQAA